MLFCDNLFAIALSFNLVQHQKTKHIDMNVYFVKERIAKKQLGVQFVSFRERFADIFTKGLSAPLFRTCSNLMLENMSLRRHVRVYWMVIDCDTCK